MAPFSYVFIGGLFNASGGKERVFAQQLFQDIDFRNPGGLLINGGYEEELLLLPRILQHKNPSWKIPKVVIWNIETEDPSVDKLAQTALKEKFPHVLFVPFFDNRRKKYTPHELIFRALAVKANLFVELGDIASWCAPDSGEIGPYWLLDPLGNQYCDTKNSRELARCLVSRLTSLLGFMRTPSQSEEGQGLLMRVPGRFLELSQFYATLFHEAIHGKVETSRLLGNISFRCERGFPSFRNGEYIQVSRRNIDKRFITEEDFVPVKLSKSGPFGLVYEGSHKPSVDAPIQVHLYKYYPNVNFMMHSHAYIRNAPFTKRVIPCGCIEETNEITKVYPEKYSSRMCINLLGHGSLAMSDTIEGLENIDYIPRNIPEIHE